MSLYKDASLVMIPSAYKDGKLYSIRPTDGSGDFTFSRGSNLAATRVDVNGLIEKGRENIFLYSNAYDQPSWGKSSITLTSGQTGYDNSNDAWLVEISAVNANLRQSITTSGVNTYSVYAKAGSLGWLRMNNNVALSYFDLANLTIGTTSGTGFIDSSITSVGNGWVRCSLSFVGDGVTNRFYPADADNSFPTSGSIYIQDAQLEAGLVATDYIETGASTAQAGILEDMPRLDYSGGASCPALLLEPQRTNIATNSEYMLGFNKGSASALEANAAISPDGKYNATYFYCNTTTTNGYLLPSFNGTSGVQYAVSFYAKAKELNRIYIKNVNDSGGQSWFDLSDGTYNLLSGIDSMSIESAGDGWYRCTAVSTSTTTGIKWIPILKGDANEGVYVYGLQVEQGSYPTSYIPTYGSSVTRSSETSVNTSTSVLESLEGDHTIVYDFNIDSGREGSALFLLISRSNGYYGLKGTSSSDIQVQAFTQGDFSGTQSMNGLASGNHKIAIRWSNNEGSVFLDGVKQPNTLTDTPTTTSYVQVKYDGGGYKNKANQQSIFPTALTDSECIALTTL